MPFYSGDAIVLLSGGQDSTTCLFWAKTKFKHIIALSFDISQNNIIELDCAKVICEKANVDHNIIDLKLLHDFKGEKNFISGRNLFFLSFAALIAKQRNISNIVIGVSQQDSNTFSDCSDNFIKSINVSMNLSMDYTFKIYAPLIWLSKKEIWHLAEELDIINLVKNNTVTCYNGISGVGCGHCSACQLRNSAYSEYLKDKSGEYT